MGATLVQCYLLIPKGLSIGKHFSEPIIYSNFKEHLQSTIDCIREAGLYKSERVIEGPQDAKLC